MAKTSSSRSLSVISRYLTLAAAIALFLAFTAEGWLILVAMALGAVAFVLLALDIFLLLFKW